MQLTRTITQLSIFIFVIVVSPSCNNDNALSPVIPTPNLTKLSGRIENWNLGDTVMIHSNSTYIDYPLSLNDSNDIYGSSTISSTGEFTMKLRDPIFTDSLFGYSYKIIFPIEYYTNLQNSDTSARFHLSRFTLSSYRWNVVPFYVRNASRNVRTLSDSLSSQGDYRCDPEFYYTDRNVTIKYSSTSIPKDTLSIDMNLEFHKGWNKIVTVVKEKRNKYIHLESRVNNSFEGKYYIYHW